MEGVLTGLGEPPIFLHACTKGEKCTSAPQHIFYGSDGVEGSSQVHDLHQVVKCQV